MKKTILTYAVLIGVAFYYIPSSFSAVAGKDLVKANIPQIYGKAKDSFQGSSDKTIIHIQDAHCNVESQENIQSILKSLEEQGKIDAVSVEGDWEPLKAEGFITQKTQEDRQYLTDWFTKYGLISGPLRHQILDNNNLKVFGMETKSILKEGWGNYIKSQTNKEDLSARAEKIKGVMEAIKLKLFDQDTQNFLQSIKDFESDKITLTAYAKILQAQADKGGVKWSTFNNFSKVVESIKLEDKIDFAKIDRERLDLVDELETKVAKDVSNDIVTKSLNYRLGRLSAVEYYNFILNKADSAKLDMNKYKNVKEYANLVNLYAQINDDALFAEIDHLVEAVKAKTFKNDAQVQFDKHLVNLYLVTKMIGLQMTRSDIAQYYKNKENLSVAKTIAFLKDQAKQLNLGVELDKNLAEIDNSLSSNEKFYELAMKRDDVMVENTLAMMDEKGFKTVVLVAGGFHTEGIVKAMKAQNISHCVITPRITNPDAKNYYVETKLGTNPAFKEMEKAGIESKNLAFIKEIKSTLIAFNSSSDINTSVMAEAVEGETKVEEKPGSALIVNLKALEKASTIEGQNTVRAQLDKIVKDATSGTNMPKNVPENFTLSEPIDARALAIANAFRSQLKDPKGVIVSFLAPNGVEEAVVFELNDGVIAGSIRVREGANKDKQFYLPYGLLKNTNIDLKHAEDIARHWGLLEQGEIDAENAGGEVVNLLTNIEQTSTKLWLKMQVLIDTMGLPGVDVNPRLNMIDDIFTPKDWKNGDKKEVIDLEKLKTLGIPTPSEIRDIMGQIGEDAVKLDDKQAIALAIRNFRNVYALVENPYNENLKNLDLWLQNKIDPKTADHVVAMGVDLDLFEMTLDDLHTYNKDERLQRFTHLQGGEVMMVKSDQPIVDDQGNIIDKRVNGLTGRIHQHNTQWDNEITRNENGTLKASQRVVVMDTTYALTNIDKLIEAKKAGKVIILAGKTMNDCALVLEKAVNNDLKKLFILSQNIINPFEGVRENKLEDKFAKRVIEHDPIRGIPFVEKIIQHLVNNQTQQAAEIIANAGIDQDKMQGKDPIAEITKALNAYIAEAQPLKLEDFVKRIAELENTLRRIGASKVVSDA